jgi:hypothetical protein
VAAFFTPDRSLNLEPLLTQYRTRWAVAISMRAPYAFAGLGRDQGRKVERVVGAHTLRVVLAAARTLWWVAQVRQAGTLELQRYRPWYRQKCTPHQLDIVWACREVLQEAGGAPIPRFAPELAEIHKEPENVLPLAA